MSANLTETLLVDLGLVPQAINNNNVTGRYFDVRRHPHMMAICNGGALAAAATTKLEFLQATDIGGTGAKATTVANAATATSGTKDLVATIALAASDTGDVVTINGVAFTDAASNDTAAGEFANAAGLVLCIAASSISNQVISTAAGTTVTVTAYDGYTVTVTKTQVAGDITLATTQHSVIVEIDEEDLDTEDDFYFVAPKVTTTGNGIFSVVMIRDSKSVPVTQATGASTVL